MFWHRQENLKYHETVKRTKQLRSKSNNLTVSILWNNKDTFLNIVLYIHCNFSSTLYSFNVWFKISLCYVNQVSIFDKIQIQYMSILNVHWHNIYICLTPPLFINVPVPSHVFLYLAVSILPLFTIFLLDFGTFWFFVHYLNSFCEFFN